MKRTLSMLPALCLCLALAVPAAAEAPDDMEAALQEVTALVKETLDIDDEYTSFYGSWNDGLNPGWYLSWTDDTRDLSVSCGADGVVTEVYFWRSDAGQSRFYGFDAAFPKLAEDDARARAEYWLGRLAGEGESARIDGYTVSLTENGAYRYYGTILLNGLDSPITFSLGLNADDLTSYSRSDSYEGYVGAAPDPTPAADAKAAADALSDALAFELYYVSVGGEARLRYVPVGPYTVVDAETGEAVDMDALYASFGGTAGMKGMRNGEFAEEAAAMDAGGRGLTEVELSSISNYADVIPQERLDASLRDVEALGLDGFELKRCSYSMDGDGEITASLRYTCEMTEDRLFGYSRSAYRDYTDWGDTPVVFKYITADAKTGKLISVSTSYPLWEEDRDRRAARNEADETAFLQAVAPEMLAGSAVCTLRGYDDRNGRTYARTHDGFFFPENYLFVSMNPATGTVDEYYYVWDDDAVFASSDGIVDEEAARTAYADALDVTLGYAAWPVDVDYDDPVLYRYADWGYTFVEELRLAWYYSGEADIPGVDALTGEPVTEKADGSFAYDDLSGVPEREVIEALGAVGIGFSGGEYLPGEELTMRDAVTLLLEAEGYRVDDWDDDTLRDEAVWQGFVSGADWRPDETLSGMDFIRMILGASRYGAAAELTGIWTDAGASDEADAGYAAMAGALGMTDSILLYASCTRAGAASILFGFMDR